MAAGTRGVRLSPRQTPENCGLNCHVEVPISTHRRKLGGWVGPHFELLERRKMNPIAATQRFISFFGVLQEDVNSLLLSFLLPCPFFCFFLPLSFPLPHDMPGQLVG